MVTATDLKVDDLVRVYTAPFAGQRARVVYLSQEGAGRKATVELLEQVASRGRILYRAGESARVPVAKCRKVDLP